MFSSQRLLRQHIRRVHLKRLVCGECGDRFAFAHELKDHALSHGTVAAYACDYCSKRFNNRGLLLYHAKLLHTQQLDVSRFPCTHCTATFPLSVSLVHHLRTHDRKAAARQQFSCDDCLLMFPTRLRLTTHRMIEHDVTQEFDPLEEVTDVPEHAPAPSQRRHRARAVRKNDLLLCRKCGLEFKTMAALSEHRASAHRSDHKLQCPACDKVCPNKEALRNHKRRVHGKKRSCTYCNKTFPFQYALEAHMLTHTGEKNFTCLHCKKTFYTLQQLNVHVKLVHSGRSFSCSICGSKFGTKQGRDRHVQHRHSDDRPQTCEYCGRGFVDRRSLKAHIFIHTRQSDIVCDICKRMFGTRSCLNKHIRIQHKGERKLCPICGKHIAGALSSHLKSHGEKRYKCTQCDKVYAWPQGLKEHLRTHSGDKPYHCEICNKRFLGSANFSKHKKIHQKTSDTSRRKPPAPQKILRREPAATATAEVAPAAAAGIDYTDQYQQLVMNQLMFNQTMMAANPSAATAAAAAMMQQQTGALGQTMLAGGGGQGMLNHHDVQATADGVVFPSYHTDKYH